MYVFVMPVYASNSRILQKICNSAPWGHTFRWVAEFGVTLAVRRNSGAVVIDFTSHIHASAYLVIGTMVIIGMISSYLSQKYTGL